jgi:hypothetical protein
MAINQILPGQEFICRQHVAAAGFLGRQEPAADRRNDFGLATNDPALRTGMREIGYRQGATIRPLDVPRWAMVSGHVSRALQTRGILLWAARGARRGSNQFQAWAIGWPASEYHPRENSVLEILWKACNWIRSWHLKIKDRLARFNHRLQLESFRAIVWRVRHLN